MAKNPMPGLSRPLFCPICGAKLVVPVPDSGDLPEIHRLPEHWPAPDALNKANLCAGLVVTVTLDYDCCSKCGRKISKHPSGLCMDCHGKVNHWTRRQPG